VGPEGTTHRSRMVVASRLQIVSPPDRLVATSARTLVAGGAAGSFGQVLGPALSVFWRGILTRHLGPAVFGVWALGYSIVTMVSALITGGLSASVSKHIAELRRRERRGWEPATATASLLLGASAGLVAGVLVVALAGPIGRAYHLADLTMVLIILSFMILPTSILSVLVYICVGYKDLVARPLFLDLGVNVARLVCLWSLADGGITLVTSSVAFVIASLLTALIAAVYLWRTHAPRLDYHNLRRQVVSVGAFGLPICGAGVLDMIMSATPTLMLGYLANSALVSQYDVSSTLARAALVPYWGITVLFLPQVTELVACGNKEVVSRIYALATRWALLGGLLGSAIFFGCSGELLALVFGRPFASASAVFRINLVGNLLLVTLGPSSAVLIATNRAYLILRANLGGCILNITLNAIMIPAWGAAGAALATAISQGAVGVYLLYAASDYVDTKPLLTTGAAAWGIMLTGVSVAGAIGGAFVPVWVAYAIAAFISCAVAFVIVRAREDDIVVKAALRIMNRMIGLRGD